MPARSYSSEVAAELADLAGNVKYSLREGREVVAEAKKPIAVARDKLLGLELRDDCEG